MPSPPDSTSRWSATASCGPSPSNTGARSATSSKGKPAKRTGTPVTFWADPEIFTETTEFTSSVVTSRLREMAFLNKGLEIRLGDERGEEPIEETFQYKGGLVDFVKHLNAKREPLHAHVAFFEETGDEAEVDVALQWTGGYTETVLSFANNINTHEGGTHEEGFRKALTRAINEFARDRNLLKEKDENLQGEDVREGLTAVVSVKVRQPQFEGQTKTKLGNTEVRSFVEMAMNKALPEWLKRNPGDGRRIVDKALHRRQGPDGRPAGPRPHPAQEPARVVGSARQAGRLLVDATRSAASCSSSRATRPAARPSRPATASSRRSCPSAARSSTSRRPASPGCCRTTRSSR